MDGRDIGDTVRLSGAGTVSVEASAESVLPMASLQIVMNGEVVASAAEGAGARRLELHGRGPRGRRLLAGRALRWTRPTGTARATATRGAPHLRAHLAGVRRVRRGGVVPSDPDEDRRMLTLIEAGLERIRRGRRYPEDRITHHHPEADHGAFLERPFLEALERVRARMER